jgi:hypothetical protein
MYDRTLERGRRCTGVLEAFTAMYGLAWYLLHGRAFHLPARKGLTVAVLPQGTC